MPSEPMHLIFGHGDSLYALAVNPGPKGDNVTRVTITERINHGICRIELPTDFQRKFRPIDSAHYKSQEWKTLFW